jgi:hypothetical protein
MDNHSRNYPLSPELQSALRAVIREVGFRKSSSELDISARNLSHGGCGAPLREATQALIRQRLAAWAQRDGRMTGDSLAQSVLMHRNAESAEGPERVGAVVGRLMARLALKAPRSVGANEPRSSEAVPERLEKGGGQ